MNIPPLYQKKNLPDKNDYNTCIQGPAPGFTSVQIKKRRFHHQTQQITNYRMI
jgi:hypothetical protein